ncbi:hypothetical protein ACFQ78_40380 [Streptomyces sp. NPDC056519]|uniref:hypothetical protein n=1 Tax=Streptomyces sp. NPDC056519 TaxID=3345849 RepID=UPI00368B1084
MDDSFGDPFDGIGLLLGRTGDWKYAVAYGGWPGEFGPPAPVSRDGVHVCLLEFEEENGKAVRRSSSTSTTAAYWAPATCTWMPRGATRGSKVSLRRPPACSSC